MSEFKNVSTRADLLLQDKEDMLAGYRAGLNGEPEPGSDKSRAYHHGWRNGMVDSGRASKDDAQAALAEEIVRAQQTH